MRKRSQLATGGQDARWTWPVVRASRRDLRLHGGGTGRNTLCGRALHYSGVLVHLVDFICKPGGHHRGARRYVRGHSAGKTCWRPSARSLRLPSRLGGVLQRQAAG